MIQMSVHGTLANRFGRKQQTLCFVKTSCSSSERHGHHNHSTNRVPDQDLKHFIEDEQYVVPPHP